VATAGATTASSESTPVVTDVAREHATSATPVADSVAGSGAAAPTEVTRTRPAVPGLLSLPTPQRRRNLAPVLTAPIADPANRHQGDVAAGVAARQEAPNVPPALQQPPSSGSESINSGSSGSATAFPINDSGGRFAAEAKSRNEDNAAVLESTHSVDSPSTGAPSSAASGASSPKDALSPRGTDQAATTCGEWPMPPPGTFPAPPGLLLPPGLAGDSALRSPRSEAQGHRTVSTGGLILGTRPPAQASAMVSAPPLLATDPGSKMCTVGTQTEDEFCCPHCGCQNDKVRAE